MRRCTSKAAFFGSISTIGVFAMFKVEANFVEAFFGDKVFALGAKVSTVDDCIDEFVRVRAEIAAAFNTSDAFEA